MFFSLIFFGLSVIEVVLLSFVHLYFLCLLLTEGAVRVEKNMEPHFYHIFQHTYTDPRFRGWTTNVGKDAVQALARVLLDDLRRGPAAEGDAGTVAGALARWQGVVAGVAACARSHVEDLFDEAAARGAGVGQAELMVLTGMVGQFGPTTAERVYTASTNYNYTCGGPPQQKT